MRPRSSAINWYNARGGEVGFRVFLAWQRRGLVGVLDFLVEGSRYVARDLREKTSPRCLVSEHAEFVGGQWFLSSVPMSRNNSAARRKQDLKTTTDYISRAQIFKKFLAGHEILLPSV